MTNINKPKGKVMGKTEAKKPKTSSKTNKTNTDLRLPKMRKLHFKVGQIVGAILVVLVAAFCLRVAIWEHDYLERMEGSEREAATLPVEGAEDETDSTEPTETEVIEYKVAPDKPRYLSISKIGVTNARVVEIGLKSDGALSTPYNIYDVGWYTGSVLPGEAGVSVIDGHGGAPGIGVFGSLPKVGIGDKINIVMGDGRAFTYRVVDTATKALGDEANDYMATAFASPERGKPSLTLITCTGDWWLSSRTYSHRFFARALLEN